MPVGAQALETAQTAVSAGFGLSGGWLPVEGAPLIIYIVSRTRFVMLPVKAMLQNAGGRCMRDYGLNAAQRTPNLYVDVGSRVRPTSNVSGAASKLHPNLQPCFIMDKDGDDGG